jgi:hypothetical protein
MDLALANSGGGSVHPRDRLAPASLVLLAFVIGFLPLAVWLRPPRSGDRRPANAAPPATPAEPANAALPATYAYPGLAAALALGIFGAGVVPTTLLPLSVGGYSAGFFALVGLGLLAAWAVARRRPGVGAPDGPDEPAASAVPGRPGEPAWRRVGSAAVLIGYAVVAITVPTHLGLTHMVPVGARWWLLPVVIACLTLFLLGVELVAAGSVGRRTVVLAATVVGVFAGTALGLGPRFVLIVLPLLVVLFAWHGIWATALARRSTPAWLTAVVGAILIGWPIAATMPLVT